MAYKALYRTYRPSTFKEVAGQGHIVKTLKNALACNKIAHAYLFCGPRGTGKTTMAKLLAKALNCEEGQGHQCNECSNCLAINDGSHPDVIEIDAASNNGVEDVRDIIERVKYSPIKGKYKVYIIDEVHMMSPNAFNALLKTLEEPPANVIFILATTEPHKVLPTILSRCQRYDFSKVDDTSITDRIVNILNSENISYDEKALKLIISLSDGGVRDALSLLDQAIAYCGDKITEKAVEDIFGLISIEEIVNLILNVYQGNINYVLDKVNALVAHGSDIRRLTHDLLDVCKDIVIYNKIQDEQYLVRLDSKLAKQLCDNISSDEAIEMIEVLMKAQAEFKVVNNIKSLFEVTLLKLTLINNTTKDKFQKEPQIVYVEKPVIVQPKVEEEKPVVKEEVKVTTTITEEIKETPVEEVKVEPIQKPIEQPTSTAVKENIAPVQPETVKVEPVQPKPAPQPVKPVVQQKVEPQVKQDNILQSNEVPPFMREPTPKPIVQQPVIEGPELKAFGEQNFIEDEDIIKLMVLGDKEAKMQLIGNWKHLQTLVLGSPYSKHASLLRDGKPFILTREIVVLQYDFEHLIRKVNIKENQDILQKIVSKLNGYDVKVYAINRKRAVELYNRFQSLYQVGKLPKPESVHVDIKF